jgi:multimeric flavodoxin WrbA
MKILAINASPNGKKSNTLRLVNAVLEGAKISGAEVELVDLCKLRIEFCIGCRKCHDTNECIFKDDYQQLYEKMLAADGMVWGSPNYSFGVKAQMKSLIDRMAAVIHCQYFDGKYCCAVCTGGREHEVVTDYLHDAMLDFGAYVTGSAGAVVTEGPQALTEAEAQAFELGKALADDIITQRRYFDQRQWIDRNRKSFQAKVRENKDRWRYQYAFWERMNWR